MRMTKMTATMGATCLALAIGYGGTALAQNNPTGPDDTKGTANNIPGGTGTPGTFNSETHSATSSGAKSSPTHSSAKKRAHTASMKAHQAHQN